MDKGWNGFTFLMDEWNFNEQIKKNLWTERVLDWENFQMRRMIEITAGDRVLSRSIVWIF